MLTLNDGRSELWQWDTGRTVSVDADCSQVHFSNKVFGRSIDVDVVDGVAIIPDVLLQTDKELNVWAFVGTAENGYTKISKTFKINRRNKPADYVFTPVEQTTIAEIAAIAQSVRDDADAGLFDGKPGENGSDGQDGRPGKDGAPGADGKTPEYGVDYGTPEQIAGIAQQAAEILQPEVDRINGDLVELDSRLIVTEIVEPTPNSVGRYLNATGSAIYTGYNVGNPVYLKKGDVIKVKTSLLANMVPIAYVYNVNSDRRIDGLAPLSVYEKDKEYEYTATHDVECVKYTYSTNAEVSVKVLRLNKDYNINPINQNDNVVGYYNGTNGLISGGGIRTVYINLNKGETLHVGCGAGTYTAVNILTEVNSENRPIAQLLRATSNDYTEYVYNAPYDMIVAWSFSEIVKAVAYIKEYLTSKELNKVVQGLGADIESKINAKPLPTNIVNNTNNVVGRLQINGLNGNLTSYRTAEWFSIKKEKHYAVQCFDKNNNHSTSTFYVLTAQTMSDYYADVSQNTYASYDGNIVITTDKDCYCRISIASTSKKILVIEKNTYDDLAWVDYTDKPQLMVNIDDYGFLTSDDLPKDKINYAQMFNKILCIGDSITEGYRTTGHAIDKTRSYPSFLQKMLNNEVTNGGMSGATPKSWWSSRVGTYTFSEYDAFIINLGQNEGLTDTLDTDVNPYTNPTDFRDTNTGWYCRIIEKIRTENPNSMVFLGKGQKDAVTNSVIEKIGAKYNYPVIDYTGINPSLNLQNRHTSRDGVSYTVHFNTLGYFELADAFCKAINSYISENTERFMEVKE